METQELDLLVEISALRGQAEAGTPVALLAARGTRRDPRALIGLKQTGDVKSGSARAWQIDEDDLLRKKLGYVSERAIANSLGRTRGAVRLRWRRGLRLTAPSKASNVLTCEQIAQGLGMDCKSAMLLIDRGILPGRLLPFENRKTRVVERVTFLRWVVNPMNWVYFKTQRVGKRIPRHRRAKLFDTAFWAYVRRLIELKRSRWDDEWLTPGQVVRLRGLCVSNYVAEAIRAGKLPAKRWGNWRILKSDALAAPLSVFIAWHGKGGKYQDRVYVSPAADAFLVLAHAVGHTHEQIGKMMYWKERRVCDRLTILRKRRQIAKIICENNLPVRYDPKTGGCYADYREQRARFPALARFMDRYIAGEQLNRFDTRLVHRILMKAAGSPSTPTTERKTR